ncbi:MAG: hypothetical protein ACRDQB_07170 [Thermocrispum sp.]
MLAAVATGSGSILESAGVRRAGAYGGTARELVRLRRQWVYFAGLGVDVLGFACAVAALHWLPLFLVQTVLAFSVGVTAAISAFLGIRLAAAGWVALAVGAAGLVLLGLSAEPGPARVLEAGWRWALLGMALPVLGVAWLARRRSATRAAPLLAFASGLGFSVVGIAARTLPLPDATWRLLLEPAAWAIVVNALAATVVFAMALQAGRPTGVTAIMYTTKTALASFVGLVYLDDQVRAGFGAAAVLGFAAAIAGAIVAAHFSALAVQRRPDRMASR